MTYRLAFSDKAKREWNKLDSTIQTQFEKVLVRRLEQPRVPAARIRGAPERYKIKLRGVGYRLLYDVEDQLVRIVVIAVGRRDNIYDEI